MRPRGRTELARALADRGFGREAASQASIRLEAEGWLDNLCKVAFVDIRPLEAELPEREGPALRRAFERLWARHSGLPLRERRQKVSAALSRRGFAASDISAMIRSSHEVR